MSTIQNSLLRYVKVRCNIYYIYSKQRLTEVSETLTKIRVIYITKKLSFYVLRT